MLIQEKYGNIHSGDYAQYSIDWLLLQWYETSKRILRRQTERGKELSLKFLQENPSLKEGDILYQSGNEIIAVSVLPCECLVIQPANMFEMASICYEIGNKHLPLFYEEDCLLVPMDKPLLHLLSSQGYRVLTETRKLLHPLKTTVAPHGDSGSLFSKIMKRTASS